MKLEEVFYQLLQEKQVKLRLTKTQAESLRVSIIRKFKDYKKQVSTLGWLEPALETAVVSMEYTEEQTTYFLRPRKQAAVEYFLLD